MKLRNLTMSALALILMTGCGDATGVEPDDIAGTWTATSTLFTQVSDNTVKADPVVDDGAVVTLALGANLNYTFTFVLAPDSETEVGTFEVTGDELTLTPAPPTAELPQVFVIARDDDLMTLIGTDTFEFDEQAGEQAAQLVVTLVR
jgi:hypothetical protein